MSNVPQQAMRKSGLIDSVIAQLRANIADHSWPIGSKIPSEPELVDRTGAGRNTVREAVQSLVHAGLLERRQGSGTYVIADKEMAAAMSRSIGGAMHQDVLEVRLALEVAAARFAAIRRTDDDVERLRALATNRTEALAIGDLDAMTEIDLSLHRAIADASHNVPLAEIYDNLIEALQENIRFNFAHSSHVDDAHEAIIEAIAERDPDRAEAEVAAYLLDMIAAVIE